MKNYTKKLLTVLTELKTTELSQLESLLGVSSEGSAELQESLRLLANRNIVRLNGEKVELKIPEDYRLGLFRGNEKGFGFLLPFSGEKDFYVFHKNLRGSLDGDIVLGKITRPVSGTKLAEVKIMEIIEEGSSKYLGTYYSNGDNGYVMLNNKRIAEPIYISQSKVNGAEDEQSVFVSILMRGKKGKGISGEVVDVLGSKGDIGLEILTMVRERNIDVDFSPEALAEAEAKPEVVSETDIKGRIDLRNEIILTIDGSDSKDLDDAISIKKLPNGNHLLGVHIADVAHYVTEGSALDQDALQRATSVYLVDRVIPMLPRKLSNGICSLNPHVDRLTLSCTMEVNGQGKVVHSKIEETVINSKRRMTYDDVKAILSDKDEVLISEYQDIYPTLLLMEELARIFMVKRANRGSIDFDFAESKVILDENNVPIDIKKYERNLATRLIEEFMIAANETVSEVYTNLEIPFVYRIHEYPDPIRMGAFKDFIQLFGFALPPTEFTPKLLQQLLAEIKGSSGEYAIQYMMLRSLKKAVYSPDNIGHFGLASEFYSHFTSPIRRYPDLQIHRIIKEHLAGRLSSKRKENLLEVVKESSEHSSKQELNAQGAERDSVQLKKAEYMQDKIGEKYEGIVSGITEYGLYVQLDNTVEGLIHITKMKDDYYNFDEATYSFTGERTGKRHTLGDKVQVELVHVNVLKREIDFAFAEPEAEEVVDEA